MKYIITVFVLAALSVPFSGSFFDLAFTGLDGSTIATSAYEGKKVIVFAFNGSRPDLAMLHSLDSIQRSGGDSIQVVGFPAMEFDSTASSQAIAHLRDSMDLTIALARPARVQKSSGAAQIPLFQWLTSSQGNGRFNRDVEEEGMLFVVSKTGMLYSIINKGLYTRVLSRVLR